MNDIAQPRFTVAGNCRLEVFAALTDREFVSAQQAGAGTEEPDTNKTYRWGVQIEGNTVFKSTGNDNLRMTLNGTAVGTANISVNEVVKALGRNPEALEKLVNFIEKTRTTPTDDAEIEKIRDEFYQRWRIEVFTEDGTRYEGPLDMGAGTHP